MVIPHCSSNCADLSTWVLASVPSSKSNKDNTETQVLLEDTECRSEVAWEEELVGGYRCREWIAWARRISGVDFQGHLCILLNNTFGDQEKITIMCGSQKWPVLGITFGPSVIYPQIRTITQLLRMLTIALLSQADLKKKISEIW